MTQGTTPSPIFLEYDQGGRAGTGVGSAVRWELGYVQDNGTNSSSRSIITFWLEMLWADGCIVCGTEVISPELLLP